jgi:hypothetical protein
VKFSAPSITTSFSSTKCSDEAPAPSPACPLSAAHFRTEKFAENSSNTTTATTENRENEPPIRDAIANQIEEDQAHKCSSQTQRKRKGEEEEEEEEEEGAKCVRRESRGHGLYPVVSLLHPNVFFVNFVM